MAPEAAYWIPTALSKWRELIHSILLKLRLLVADCVAVWKCLFIIAFCWCGLGCCQVSNADIAQPIGPAPVHPCDLAVPGWGYPLRGP